MNTKAGNDDRGFTLIELVFAITLSLMIGGVVVAALLTSLNASSSTSEQISDSSDAGLITAFLTRDAQSAGGIVPTTAVKDSTVGVSNANTAAGWGGCQQPSPATLVLRFSWFERTSTLAQSKVVVTYGLGANELTRRICRDSTTGPDLLLGRNIATVVATCNSTCGSTTTKVTLAVTALSTRSPLSYTLQATVRGGKQTTPTVANSTPVPLLALGAGASAICPNVEMVGSGDVTVVGSVLVDSLCGDTPIKDDSGSLQPTGVTSSVAGIVDPFAARAKPSTTCSTSGTNPATIGVSASATTIVKYPQPVDVTDDTTFQPGRFMFCQGLTLTSGNITGHDVLLYIYRGTFEVKAGAMVDLSGRSTTDKQMLIWSIQANQTIKIAAGPRVSSYRGLIYAPLARMELSSEGGANIGAINTQGLTVTGEGQARLGLSIPVMAITPATTLETGQVNIAYSSSSLVASGGTAPYTWSASGLPANLTMNATTGAISGTPTTAGTMSPIIVTVFDATKAAASFDYSMTINAAIGIADSPTLPNGQVGVGYATTTLAPSGGTTPYAWSITGGSPPGLTMAADGSMSGTPTAAGTFSVVVQLADAMGAVATKTYTVTIAAPVASCPDITAGWRAEYYDNATLTEPIKLCRDDANIDFDWGSGSPDVTLPPDNFSVRWTKTHNLTAGTYTFTMGSDDGSRLYIDGALVLDRWFDQGYPAPQPTVAVALAGGDHTIVMEYYERGGAARATVTWVVASQPAPACPADARVPNNYWQGQYYGNATLTGAPALTRNDEAINFNWGTSSPASGLPTDNFSIRWTRTSVFAAGAYTFALGTDDGGRLYIDGALVLDRWVDQGYPSPQPSIAQTLSQGSHTIVVEYFEHGGDARATLATTLPANGVIAVPSACGDLTYFGEQRISLSNSLPIDSMTATIKVRQTAGVGPNSQYVTFEGGNVTAGNTTSAGFITYTFTVIPGKTIVPGQWTMAAQWNGTGTPHPAAGDTWTVTTHTTAGTQTVSGTF